MRLLVASGLPSAVCLTTLPLAGAETDMEEDGELAETDDAADAPPDETSEDSNLPSTPRASDGPLTTGHQGQFGLRVGIVGGYRMMFRYAESPFCGPPSSDEGEACFYGSPLATDLALSFGLLDSLEIFGWTRLGLGRDTHTDTDALRALGAGVRIYTMSDAPLKIFFQPAVAFSFEGGGSDPQWRARGGTQADYRSDLLLQFLVGPQYDFNRHFGVYAGAGMTAGALRAMSATMELTFGLEGRYP